jgi:hypothetical protein
MGIVRRSGIIVLALCALWPYGATVAAETPSSGITVAPAIVTMSLPKDQTVQETSVSVRNNATKQVRLSATIGGIQETNNGTFAPSAIVDPGLTNALFVDQTDITLDGGKSVNLKLQVRDTPALTPGGHYASLLIRDVENTGQNVTLSHAVSVRVFVIKETGAVRAVRVDAMRDDGGLFRVPSTITATFSNPGNVGVVPRASIGLYDPRGRLVASGVLNTESVTVLPSKQAQLRTVMLGEARAWLPGEYEQRISYRYEGSDEQTTGSASMIIIPPLFIGMSVLGLGVLIGLAWLIWRFWPRRKGSFVIKRPHAHSASEQTSETHVSPPRRQKPPRIDIM